ncbi:MAG: hypothetical protein Satyrvirus28_12 [Satyrvirus sp.]|uniref:Uncharacterized protein n=1 Tax=Satyrvirus sp. TaxID=2487771 RepID=A0A3G5AGC7_9VIRU|nr:MAG: hypothetical protein Satyrvirus28_12 [Satyrvirus sp.]
MEDIIDKFADLSIVCEYDLDKAKCVEKTKEFLLHMTSHMDYKNIRAIFGAPHNIEKYKTDMEQISDTVYGSSTYKPNIDKFNKSYQDFLDMYYGGCETKTTFFGRKIFDEKACKNSIIKFYKNYDKQLPFSGKDI